MNTSDGYAIVLTEGTEQEPVDRSGRLRSASYMNTGETFLLRTRSSNRANGGLSETESEPQSVPVRQINFTIQEPPKPYFTIAPLWTDSYFFWGQTDLVRHLLSMECSLQAEPSPQ